MNRSNNKKLLLLLLIAFFIQSNLFSFNFPTYHPLLNNTTEKDSNALYFNFYNANFLWNNEFFNDVVNGYTLIGYFITPQLQYHFSPNIKIDAGVHLLKYSGVDDYSRYTPTYSISYSKKDYTLIMGTLKGTLNHGLPDQILFSERYFTDNLENGVQYKLSKEKFYFDTWLDWQNFIFPLSNEQEKLIAGISAEPFVIKNQNWEFSIPMASIVGHQGGQIDTIDANMKTIFNYNVGIRGSKTFHLKYLDHISFETFYLGYKDNSPTIESLYARGEGFLSQIRLGFDNNFIQLGYWKSNRFLSLMGHPIYQSFSEKNSEKHKKNRELITAHIFYSKSIHKGIYLGFMADTYFDVYSGNVDYSMGLTLIIKNNFFVKRFK